MSVILKPRDIEKIGSTRATFYLADCLEVFQQLGPESVDVIVTSPPYNLGIAYNRYQDTMSSADYLAWTDKWIAAAARVIAARLTRTKIKLVTGSADSSRPV